MLAVYPIFTKEVPPFLDLCKSLEQLLLGPILEGRRPAVLNNPPSSPSQSLQEYLESLAVSQEPKSPVRVLRRRAKPRRIS